MSVKELLAELVNIDSMSSRSNVEIVSYLEDCCRELGFGVKRYAYKDDAGIEKANLVCIAGLAEGAAQEVDLALVGHTDTVPYDPNWLEATTLTEREGKLYGRGACDTKAFIAAALTAVEDVGAGCLRRPLALIFTADEEIGLLGAKRLVAEQPLRVRNAIVGEPTSLQPIRAGKGYCLAEIIVRGREAHSAYPALGSSAIFRAARLITRIEEIAEKLTQEQHPDFNPAFTTLNVGLIHGGSAKNVIAGECRFTLEWRTIPGQTSGKLLEYLGQAIDEQKTIDPEFDCEVKAGRADTGFETAPNAGLVTLLEKATGKQAGTVAFGTEAAQLTQLGAEAVVLGPGDIRVAHRTGEYVPTRELEGCVEVLRQAIEQICT
ncbi:MAG TPA: acetylornithine deacetylase [Pyrinomonadaceae bacterium]|nr:acetylornithine deacetylase [Pyrinomonadaceae bacterium]